MAGIQLSLSNAIRLIAALAPLLLGSFMLLLSIFNQNAKGLVYLAGVMLASVINIFLMNMMKVKKDPEAAMTCNLVELPYISNYNSPSGSALFIAFTFGYLFMPMQFNNNMNYAVISTLLVILAMDAVVKISNKCTTVQGSLVGSLVGVLLGIIWYSILHSAGADSLLYFDEVESNNVVCSKPSTQTFRCSVYKNGQLVQSGTA